MSTTPPSRRPTLEPSRRPTLESVAARAGVSRATVSRVVNGSPAVRAPVRERVERSIAELGYIPNRAARTLVTHRTDAVALVVSEPESMVFSDPFFGAIIRGASAGLATEGLQLVLMLVQRAEDYPRIERYLSGGHVDGVLLASLHRGDPLIPLVQRLRLPAVYGGTPWETATDLLWVDVDNVEGGRLATSHLVGSGRRRIATITGPLDQHAAADRLSGYLAALGDAADSALVEQGGFTRESGEAAMTAILERVPDVDAVFAASDLMAAGALRALRRAGRRVPEDVAVVGFDDIDDLAGWTEPPLTTVHQSPVELGSAMVALLVSALRGAEDVAPRRLDVRLVVRSSA